MSQRFLVALLLACRDHLSLQYSWQCHHGRHSQCVDCPCVLANWANVGWLAVTAAWPNHWPTWLVAPVTTAAAGMGDYAKANTIVIITTITMTQPSAPPTKFDVLYSPFPIHPTIHTRMWSWSGQCMMATITKPWFVPCWAMAPVFTPLGGKHTHTPEQSWCVRGMVCSCALLSSWCPWNGMVTRNVICCWCNVYPEFMVPQGVQHVVGSPASERASEQVAWLTDWVTAFFQWSWSWKKAFRAHIVVAAAVASNCPFALYCILIYQQRQQQWTR